VKSVFHGKWLRARGWVALLSACGQYADYDAAELAKDRVLIECVYMREENADGRVWFSPNIDAKLSVAEWHGPKHTV
jgi:hypothetical protein